MPAPAATELPDPGPFVNFVGSTCAPGDVLEPVDAVALVPDTVGLIVPDVVVVVPDTVGLIVLVVVVVPVVVVVVPDGVVVVVVGVGVVGVDVPWAAQYAAVTWPSYFVVRVSEMRSRLGDPAAYVVPFQVVARFQVLLGVLR